MENFLPGFKTYIGIIIAIAPAVAKLFGYDLGDLTGLEDQLVTVVGGIIAVIGRVNVRKA